VQIHCSPVDTEHRETQPPLRQLIILNLSVEATCLESATYTRARKKRARSGIFLLNKCGLLQLSLKAGLTLTCWTSAALLPLGYDGNQG